MNKAQKFLLKHEEQIKYSLIGIGISLILIGIFVDFSWLKTIGDSYATDGDCGPFKILDLSLMIFTIGGSVIIIFAIKYFKELLNGKNNLETILKLAVFFILLLYLISSQIRYFDSDEYEHLHKAWLTQEGTIPYISIASAHMPLLEWIILSFMQITGESTIIIQTMRLFMFLVSCASLWLIYIITKELFKSENNALVAILLVITNLVWIKKSPEIRPDNIMLFFVLLSFWILIQYHKNPKAKYLLMFGFCSFFSFLGKQNAAVFYFALGVAFSYDAIFRKKLLNTKTIAIGIIGTIITIIFFKIDFMRELLIINIMRHLVPSDFKFLPIRHLVQIWKFNPVVFLLFIFQLFSPIKLSKKYEIFKKYLITVSLTCFVFLFLMNRPWMQEMLVMLIFMSILGSNILVEMIQNLNWKLGYVIIGVVILPALIFIPHTALYKQWTDDLETTKTILEISERDDLVFDACGKAIFRHHPLEPEFLMYLSQIFDRLDEVKKSNVRYLIKDKNYYPRFPEETLNWFENNFIQTNENPNIFVRINHTN